MLRITEKFNSVLLRDLVPRNRRIRFSSPVVITFRSRQSLLGGDDSSEIPLFVESQSQESQTQSPEQREKIDGRVDEGPPSCIGCDRGELCWLPGGGQDISYEEYENSHCERVEESFLHAADVPKQRHG